MSQITEAGVPAPYATAPAAPSRTTALGRVAMIVGLGVLAGSLLASVLMGIAAAPYATAGPTGFGVSLSLASGDPVEFTLAVLAFVHILLGTALGLWALTQGIVAITADRGRAFGITALVAAVVAPGVSLVVYMVIAISNAPR